MLPLYTPLKVATKALLALFALAYMGMGILTMIISIPDAPDVTPPSPSIQMSDDYLPPLMPSVVYAYEHSVVRISVDGRFDCSGVVVSQNYVLTASHCLVDHNWILTKKTILVENDDLSIGVAAKAVGINTRLDWGLIQGDFSKIPGAHLISETLELQEAVAACGYPMSNHKVYCSLLRPQVNDGFFIKCAGVVFPGMSGGPVFDNNGNVIGLNIQVYGASEGGGAAYSPTLGILATFGIGD